MRPTLVCACLTAALCLAPPARAQTWTPVGPPGGSVRSLAADPRDPARIFLGTADGMVYRSADGGASWEPLRPGFPLRGMSLDQLVVDPEGVLYAGYWDVRHAGGGVARSTDGGRTFARLEGLAGESVRALALAPSNPRVLAAGTLSGVFVSRNGGATWKRVTPEGSPELRNFESLAFDPGDDAVLYAGTWHLGFRTSDAGGLWDPVHDGMIADSDIMSLTVDRTDPRTVYATACTGVYRWDGPSARWSRVAGIPEASQRTRAFAQDVDDPALLFAGTTKGLWRSDDGGRAWALATPGRPIVNAVLSLPGGTVLLGTEDAGVLRSTDHGRTWSPGNAGFSDRFVSRLVFDPADHRVFALVADDAAVFAAPSEGGPWVRLGAGLEGRHVLALARLGGTLVAGTDNGLFVLRAAGGGWRRVTPPPGSGWEHARVGELAILPPAQILAATSAGLVVSRDAGRTWSATMLRGVRVDAFATFPDAPRLLVAAAGADVLRSEDAGRSWALLSRLPAGAAAHALAVLPSNPRIVLAATTGGLVRSADRGASWQTVTQGLRRSSLSGLALHPDGRTIYASDYEGGGIFVSSDGGASWRRLPAGDLPSARVWSVAVDPAAPGRVYASSSSGLYRLDPAAASSAAASSAAIGAVLGP